MQPLPVEAPEALVVLGVRPTIGRLARLRPGLSIEAARSQ